MTILYYNLSLVSRYVRVIQVKTGARLKRREARARQALGPRLGTRIKPPGIGKDNLKILTKILTQQTTDPLSQSSN